MTIIEVYADIWCPFTHVGLKRLIERRADPGAFTLRVRLWPLQIINEAPMDAAFIGEEVEELRTQVAPDLFGGFRVDRFPQSTLGALGLAELAYERSMDCGERVSIALRDALFEEGRDVGDPEVLAAIAATEGLDPTADGSDLVRASLEAGRARGVVGSPHFFTGNGGFFCPALHVERIVGQLQIRADPDAFEAFVQSCVATDADSGT